MKMQREEVCRLLDQYGPALSERCKDVLEMYFDDDLSLAEVAENCGISRQGVLDAIKRGESELAFLEASLGISRKYGEIVSLAEQIAASSNDKHIQQMAEEIIQVITDAERE